MEPLDAPYHSKFFDVITIPSPAQSEATHPQLNVNSANSIMCYEDAILNAIKDLKDSHNGSTVSAIKKHIGANFFHDNYPGLREEDADSLSQDPTAIRWNDALFVQALKSVIDKKCVTRSTCIKNGSTHYKFSDSFKKHRAEELKKRLERLESYKAHQRKKKKQILSERKEERMPVHKPTLKKGHLVESKAVAIVGNCKKSQMELDHKNQIEKRSALPHQLGLCADESLGSKKKSLREKLKIPHKQIFVKEIVQYSKRKDSL